MGFFQTFDWLPWWHTHCWCVPTKGDEVVFGRSCYVYCASGYDLLDETVPIWNCGLNASQLRLEGRSCLMLFGAQRKKTMSAWLIALAFRAWANFHEKIQGSNHSMFCDLTVQAYESWAICLCRSATFLQAGPVFLGVADILGDWLHRQLHWSCIPRAVHAAVCNRIHNPHKRHKCLAICDLSMWQWWGGPGWQHATYMRLGCRDALWPCIDEDRRGSMKPREWGFASWSKSTALKIPKSERTRSLETRNDINIIQIWSYMCILTTDSAVLSTGFNSLFSNLQRQSPQFCQNFTSDGFL